jgi:hypothetical protein
MPLNKSIPITVLGGKMDWLTKNPFPTKKEHVFYYDWKITEDFMPS